MWNNNLQTLMVGMIMAVGVSLSGCDNSQSDAQNQDANANTSEQASANDAPAKDSAAGTADLDGATTAQATPVRYDVSSWGSGEVTPLGIDKLEEIKSTFGKVVSTDENSLDYASNAATKYRFMKADAPYLDLIDSEKYLELGWYYANPTDSDKEKELSQNHAKKAYKIARQLMGDEGGKMVGDMLNSQITKNKVVGGQKVELAKCEFYSCMLVINKSEAPENNS
ncbi:MULTISPECIES: hypothetical protein [Psychrobacter]|uniref:Lipoprotein n=1 Tax=Psychrobacter alimentarius TaxID=261164 RepID=A0ABM5ZUX7_9GAMM|nr:MULTISPECIES: hypothetical protein [Psychrobacter]AMT95817.1 hypothetical protein A3K91_0181 [Psychrobacter alimentarius]QCB31762.1 hypothetical protein E5677_12580 [Psychrobacter sp. PAMC27889]